MDDKSISKFTRHADRSFILLLWAGLVGVLFYGCGRDSSLQLSSNPVSPRIRLSVSSTSDASGTLVDVSDRILISAEGMTELAYDRGSAVVIKPKSAWGSKFVGWKVEPASAAEVAEDGRLLISELKDNVLAEAQFEKITQVSFQVKFKNKKSPIRSNMVRWKYYMPGNTSGAPDGEEKCPMTQDEVLQLVCKPHVYPFGTKIEIESGTYITPNHQYESFTLDKEQNVLEYELSPALY